MKDATKVNLFCLFYKPDLGQNQNQQCFVAYSLILGILGTSNFRHSLFLDEVRTDFLESYKKCKRANEGCL